MSELAKRFYAKIGQEIIPGIYAHRAERIINAAYIKTESKTVASLPENIDLKGVFEQLKKDFSDQLDRKKSIEDKAKTFFATISISITAITFTLNYSNINFNTPVTATSIIILALSIFCIIMASIRAMEAIKIGSFNVFQTEIQESETEILIATTESDADRIQRLVKLKILNDKIILKAANYCYAAGILVRNGIILFAIYFILGLIDKLKLPCLLN